MTGHCILGRLSAGTQDPIKMLPGAGREAGVHGSPSDLQDTWVYTYKGKTPKEAQEEVPVERE